METDCTSVLLHGSHFTCMAAISPAWQPFHLHGSHFTCMTAISPVPFLLTYLQLYLMLRLKFLTFFITSLATPVTPSIVANT
jgi:hypothetical protein